MKSSIKHIGMALKAARVKKGLSQRALAITIGLPQSHISKIESGLVDIQISTLIDLSRFLDLEPMLVPRILVPALQALERGVDKKTLEPRPMYRLDEEENEE